MPRQSAGQPPFEDAAAATIAAARGERRRPAVPVLTAEEKAEADKAAAKAPVCRFCIGYHPEPNSPGCPRIASFELDGDGRVKSAAYWPGKAWAKGRVVLFEDTKEEVPDA